MKRWLKKINKRTIVTWTFMIAIFVMSLGYAALSQFIEIEGIALIDRTWDIKVVNVTSSTQGEGQSVSNPYVGSTVTMNANLPTATSKVTYTITLKNEGNVRAKLHSIEKVSDKNNNIIYTISGVEEGTTKLGPGEENTVTVVMNYANGVTSTSNIEKRLMLSFNYVEDTESNGSGGTTVVYDEYSLGDLVTLVDGSKWTVVENSNSKQEYITLWANNAYGEKYQFDSTGNTLYDPSSQTNIGYIINGTILPMLKNNLLNNDGDVAGLSARLITYNEFNSLKDEIGIYGLPFVNDTWLMTESDLKVYAYLQADEDVVAAESTDSHQVRPVIIIKKSNIYVSSYLADRILSDNQLKSDIGVDFSKTTEETGTNGLYYTSTNTEGNLPTYYFRGIVENNYVKLSTGKTMCNYNGTEVINATLVDSEYADQGAPPDLEVLGTVNSAEECTATEICIDWGGTHYVGIDQSYCEYMGGTWVNETATYGEAFLDWRIVRINEDGSVRLITDASVGTSNFNGSQSSSMDNTYVGYMTGTSGSSSYDETHSNANNSNIKDYLDDWYTNNVSVHDDNISSEAGFCNDRSIATSENIWSSSDTALGYGTNETYYGVYNRLNNLKLPQFACPQNSDLFTLESSTKGNKKLTTPIGLLTLDEVIFAGMSNDSSIQSSKMYLIREDEFWTMSPSMFSTNAKIFAIGYGISSDYSYNEKGVRPVINLKSTVKVSDEIPEGCTKQNGTQSCPYIIQTNQ